MKTTVIMISVKTPPPRGVEGAAMKHDSAYQTLKNAKGQLDASLKMLEDNRYCVDISNQLMATIALIKRANKQILSEHLNHCVIESIENRDAEAKIKEIEQLIERMM